MAEEREPPPLFDESEDTTGQEENEDLFESAKEMSNSVTKNTEKEEEKDIFADAQDEVALDSADDEVPQTKSTLVVNNHSTGAELETTDISVTSGNDNNANNKSNDQNTGRKSPKLTVIHNKAEEEVEEDSDQHSIEITVTDPVKRGEGMGAYMAYKVSTNTTLPQFNRSQMGVYRRFSDFLGLHEKLAEKHQHQGRIVPPAPEKSVVGMTKIKMSKEDQGSGEFVEKRRASLERFLNRIAKHKVLREDPDFIEFLEKEEELPKSSSTSALSGAGVMRLFSKMGDSLGKITFKMDETDQWFEDKQQQIDSLDHQLRKLHSSIESLVNHRKELAVNTNSFARSTHLLGSTEENTSLSRALSQLAEVEEKLDQVHNDQANNDFFVLSELIKDYISLIGSIKEVFGERVKIFKNWKEAEMNLQKKVDERTKLEQQRKMDKIPAVSQEITKWESKVEKGKEEFEAISKVIKKEIAAFERQRVKDFKNLVINYLESLKNSQQEVIRHWETFLPEAKAIA